MHLYPSDIPNLFAQMRLQGPETGRKGHLSIATELS